MKTFVAKSGIQHVEKERKNGILLAYCGAWIFNADVIHHPRMKKAECKKCEKLKPKEVI